MVTNELLKACTQSLLIDYIEYQNKNNRIAFYSSYLLFFSCILLTFSVSFLFLIFYSLTSNFCFLQQIYCFPVMALSKSRNYSLPKLQPNSNHLSNSRSLIPPPPKQRLSFPLIGDSGYYGGVGRKHYERNTNLIKKLILNFEPEKGDRIQRSNSEVYIKTNPQNQATAQYKKDGKRQINSKEQTVLAIEQQLGKKLAREINENKMVQNNLGQPSKSEIVRKKDSLDQLIKSNVFSQQRIFPSLQRIYSQIHQSPNLRLDLHQLNRKRFNPTFLSSDLGYV